MKPSNSKIIDGVRANANLNSVPAWATEIPRFSVQAVSSSASINGTIQLQVSNDRASGLPPNQFIPTNWINLGTAVTINSAAAVMVPAAVAAPWFYVIESCYEYIRVTFTDSSGGTSTGLLTVNLKVL